MFGGNTERNRRLKNHKHAKIIFLCINIYFSKRNNSADNFRIRAVHGRSSVKTQKCSLFSRFIVRDSTQTSIVEKVESSTSTETQLRQERYDVIFLSLFISNKWWWEYTLRRMVHIPTSLPTKEETWVSSACKARHPGRRLILSRWTVKPVSVPWIQRAGDDVPRELVMVYHFIKMESKLKGKYRCLMWWAFYIIHYQYNYWLMCQSWE